MRSVFHSLLVFVIVGNCFGHVMAQAAKSEAPTEKSAPPPSESNRNPGPPIPGKTLTTKEREQALQEQAHRWQETEQLRKEGKLPECQRALEKTIALEKDLFGDTTHTLLYLVEYLGHVEQQAKNQAAARQSVTEAIEVQLRFLGDEPCQALGRNATAAEKLERFQQAIEIRKQALGESHPWVGLSLVDLALTQEADGHSDLAEASLEQALKIFKAKQFEMRIGPQGHSPDAHYHLDRIRLSGEPSSSAAAVLNQVPEDFKRKLEAALKQSREAEACEVKGDIPQARALWASNPLEGYQAAGGSTFSCSEQVQLEMAQQYRVVLDRFLSFAGRAGLPDKDASRMYFGISNLKGAIYTHMRRIRLERRHPSLKPFFAAYDEVNRRLAILTSSQSPGSKLDAPKLRAAWPLLVRKSALEAEMGRRHDQLPKFMNPPPAGQLPPGSVLVDYLSYRYVPLPRERDAKKAPEFRIGCFISRPRTGEAYLDLGPLAPVAEAVNSWRRAIQRGEGANRGIEVLDTPGADESDLPQRTLRERIWQPLQPYLEKAEVVLISPDGVLAFVPFAALPGLKPGTYLLEELPLAIAPIPRLIDPLKSLTDFLARQSGGNWTTEVLAEPEDSPLLIGDVDFDAHLETGVKGKEDQAASMKFPPLPGTAREVKLIGDLFRKLQAQPAAYLTGRLATKTSFREQASRHRWLHLATHGFFAPEKSVMGLGLPELRSALVFAGASSASAGAEDNGILTALEVTSLDLDRVDLATLSACETSLGQIQEGEGVLGLQRAFLVAGVKTTVTSLWQVHDEATQALMVEFYRNFWERKLGKLEALRQAQVALMRGQLYRPPQIRKGTGEAKQDERLPPYYWAAFMLSGNWR